MNPFNKILLAAVLLPRQLYSRWGIDVPRLTSILKIKLTMDERRPNTLQATRQRRSNEKEINNATLGTMIVSVLMGLAFLGAFALSDDLVTQLTLYFSMFITMLCMSLISDFTSVLIDVRDTYIILPKPVTDSTFVMARLLHIFIYVCKILLPMCIPGIVYMAVTAGAGGAAALLLFAVFATLFSIFVINALYIIILRVTTPEKFKNIISYIQIAFAILIYAAYQILPRMMEHPGVTGLDVSGAAGMLAAPPWWFACGVKYLTTLGGTPLQTAGVFLAVVFPAASMYIVVKYLAPAFNQKLAMISGGESGGATPAPAPAYERGWAGRLGSLLTTNKAEHAGFAFATRMMSRSRDFKVRVYPGIGYFVVLLFVLYFNSKSRQPLVAADGTFGFKTVFAVYFSSIILTTAVSQITYSDRFRASWIFFTAPLSRPGDVILGALKAAILRFSFFLAAILFGAGLWLAGPAILPNLILAQCNQILITLVIAYGIYRQLPFSQSFSASRKAGQFARNLALMFVSLLIGAVHYFFYKNPAAVAALLLLSVAGLWLTARTIRRTGWPNLQWQE